LTPSKEKKKKGGGGERLSIPFPTAPHFPEGKEKSGNERYPPQAEREGKEKKKERGERERTGRNSQT